MKNITSLAVGIILSASCSLHAQTLISERTVTVPVDISTAKVVLTNAGYGTTYLVKILVPELAEPTLMNHRNEGESAPCLATFTTNKIEDIVQGRPEVIQAEVKINLSKHAQLGSADGLCHVVLTETVTTQIRGFDFIHVRQSELPTRIAADCH